MRNLTFLSSWQDSPSPASITFFPDPAFHRKHEGGSRFPRSCPHRKHCPGLSLYRRPGLRHWRCSSGNDPVTALFRGLLFPLSAGHLSGIALPQGRHRRSQGSHGPHAALRPDLRSPGFQPVYRKDPGPGQRQHTGNAWASPPTRPRPELKASQTPSATAAETPSPSWSPRTLEPETMTG